MALTSLLRLDEIASSFGPKSVLDIGCATGVLVKLQQERGVSIKGVDISDWEISNGITDRLYLGSATALPFKDNEFDFIISQDFMEHVHPDDCRRYCSNRHALPKMVRFLTFI